MASDESAGHERTEQPTSRRREEARRKGRYPASRDLPGALVLLGGLGVHAMAGGYFLSEAVGQVASGLGTMPTGDLTVDGAIARCVDAAVGAVRLGGPFLVVPTVIAMAAALGQSRFALSLTTVTPQWNRLDPWQGVKRLLSARGAVDLGRSLVKLAAVGGVAFVTLRADWPLLVGLGSDGAASASAVGRVLWDLWLRIGVTFLILAGLDYAYQWWQHEKSLRMTKEEVRQESKELEGSPLLRARIRSLHRQMATRRMMADVRRADVVLRNPTHYAVAVRYDSRRMRAPKVVGKGERLLAQRIIDEAAKHGVPIVENPPLARALFKAVALGREIPRDLYRAVAEVLAYVYALKGRPR